MTRCLIDIRLVSRDHQGFTLMELMMAVAFSSFLMIGVYGFYNAASQSYNTGVTAQTLQDGANIIISKIIAGKSESGVVYRLATAVSYQIPNGSATQKYRCGGAAQSTPCNAGNAFSELYFCQDSPCTGSNDATARWYYLDSSGTNIYYHHPVTGGSVDERIYSAPKGAIMVLRFSPAAVGAPLNVVEIDVALKQNLGGYVTNKKLAASGAASTFVLLRNHP